MIETKLRSSCENVIEVGDCLPFLRSSDYYTEPCLKDLAAREELNPGYCSRVKGFTIGRVGYGRVKFSGETDVRWLDLEQIVKFRRHEVVVYEDDNAKPPVGQGLNKAAEVTLLLHVAPSKYEGEKSSKVVERLKLSSNRQRAHFVSYDPSNGEWKFLVSHFSRFGLSEDDEEDIVMDDANAVQYSGEMTVVDNADTDERLHFHPTGSTELSHSLPAHLGLDPVRMKEMRMLMFHGDGEKAEDCNEMRFHEELPSYKERAGSPFQHSNFKISYKPSPPPVRKTPLALLEYNSSGFDPKAPGTLMMAQQNKGLSIKSAKPEGFKLDCKHETPISGSHSRNIVDAGLFMGRSFRVGWGPGGVLVHSGTCINGEQSRGILSSVISVEKVAIDNVARDENNNVKEERIKLFFNSPLEFHKSVDHEKQEIHYGSHRLYLQKLISDRLVLPGICRRYIDLVEKQLELPSLSASLRVSLLHQVMVWELIKVLFSTREISGQSKLAGPDTEEDMMQDEQISAHDIDPEALPLIRRAGFSSWLQDSVYHRVQEDVSCLSESSELQHIFFLLTGRQLDAAVELAASRGDVRLACLLSQAGGSIVNRSDLSQQLELWTINGLDYNFIEKDRIRLYELLAGNIHRAVQGKNIDWKRFLGLLIWYELPPGTDLPTVFHTYQHLLVEGKAPYPVPVYIDEGPEKQAINGAVGRHFDLAYYLMLLHANGHSEYGHLKSMFSAFASTDDPLDYHMIWHQRAVLEAINAFGSDDLHILDMGFVSQLLCLGQCHWAIYVILHIPYREDIPHLHASLIREILFQYCDTWSSQEQQRQFIESLGIPLVWLHEAMAVYYQYYRDLPKALEHFIKCSNWGKAHSIFMTSVAHTLFLSAEHSEIWRLAATMEEHKSEIDDWDLGAGIYISFYLLKSCMQSDNDTMTNLDSLESKDASCREFFGRLNESLAVWDVNLPVDARVAYSKMAEEISNLLLSDSGEDSTHETQLSCFETVTSAPLAEDLRSCHLKDAVALFTCYLIESAS